LGEKYGKGNRIKKQKNIKGNRIESKDKWKSKVTWPNTYKNVKKYQGKKVRDD
jgi:hypothetical protein